LQGYIIDIKNVKDDDLIVTILAQEEVVTSYRFYGARHSTINIGYKIDFELESTLKSTIPRLKDVLQLSFNWILDREKLYCWQRYVKLFNSHLKDIEALDPFYFELLNDLAHVMIKQNPKRAICENYIKLLEFEGRLHQDFACLMCEEEIFQNVSLVRSFLPTHARCSYSRSFDFPKVQEFFEDKTLVSFEDDEVEYFWDILLQGL